MNATLVRLLVGISMVVILAAGAFKLYDVPEFHTSLKTWMLIPKSMILPLAFAVPCIEIGIAFAWIIGLRRRLCHVAAILLLLVFTIAFVLHLAVAEPPECGCFGLLRGFEKTQGAASLLILRNVGLISLLMLPVLSRIPKAHGA